MASPTGPLIREAAQIWKYLNGIICLYKPGGKSTRRMNELLKVNLCKDLNQMKCREPESYIKIVREEVESQGQLQQQLQQKLLPLFMQQPKGYDSNSQEVKDQFHLSLEDATPQILHTIQETPTTQLHVVKTINYADHPLVVGPRYQPQDFKMANVNYLGKVTSGIALVGINSDAKLAVRLFHKRWLRSYRLTAEFGLMTEDGFHQSVVVQKATFRSMKRHMLERVLANMQSTNQRVAFQTINAPLISEEAYDLASRGLVRPTAESEPIIYALKCVEFNLPHFEIEVHTINETEDFLKTLPNTIAIKLHSAATTHKIRCVKYGPFNLEHSLLMKHWTLEEVLKNIKLTQDVLREHNLNMREPNISKVSQSSNTDTENETETEDELRALGDDPAEIMAHKTGANRRNY